MIFFAVVLLLAAAWYFRSIVVYILVSGVLSIMGRPLVDLFSSIRIRKWGFPRTLAALLTLIIIWGLIILFFLIFVPLVTKQINYFSTLETEKIVSLVEKPIKFIEDLIRSVGRNMNSDFSVQEFINQKLSEILDIEKVKGFLGSLLGVLGNIAVAVFSITFITSELLTCRRFLCRSFKK